MPCESWRWGCIGPAEDTDLAFLLPQLRPRAQGRLSGTCLPRLVSQWVCKGGAKRAPSDLALLCGLNFSVFSPGEFGDVLGAGVGERRALRWL